MKYELKFGKISPQNATIGTVVVEALADDEDHGTNAVVKYRLKTLANNHWRTFGIDENTGVITLRAALDRETQKVYELRVEASDQGSPTQLTSDLDLTIYVTDVNDYAPEFTQDVFQLTFTENLTPGQEMYKLLATVDRDDDFGQNKPIPCYYIVGMCRSGFTLESSVELPRMKHESPIPRVSRKGSFLFQGATKTTGFRWTFSRINSSPPRSWTGKRKPTIRLSFRLQTTVFISRKR